MAKFSSEFEEVANCVCVHGRLLLLPPIWSCMVCAHGSGWVTVKVSTLTQDPAELPSTGSSPAWYKKSAIQI